VSFDRYSSDDSVQARVRKLRIERELATDTVSAGVVTVPASAKRAQIDRDIRRALLGDVVHDSGRTRVPAPTSTTSVQVPASRGLTLVGKRDPELGPVCTQGAPVALANVRREFELDRAAAVRERIAEREARRAERRERKRRY
jgi:hypothetical protein